MTEIDKDNAGGGAPRAALFSILDSLGIAHRTVEHPPIFTVEEGRDLKASMPGGHSKNLFLKDKKASLTLTIAHADTKVDLVGLGRRLGAKGRLSFGKPDLLAATLAIRPGAVTPFALINAKPEAFAHLVIDTTLLAHDPVWFHPLENDASTAIAPGDLLKFANHFGFEPKIIDLARPEQG